MEDLVVYIVIIAISGLISIANKVKENEQKKKKESFHSPQETKQPPKSNNLKCPFCGAPNDKSKRFCQICGFDIFSFSSENVKQKELKKKKEIEAKAALIHKNQDTKQKSMLKNETTDSAIKKRPMQNKKKALANMNMRQIFMYKELLDKPLAHRKK